MFPKDFLWGASSGALQVEGAWNEGGKGLSIWDVYNHTPKKVSDGYTLDVSCDFYHRFREDVAIMKKLGLKTYRFSFSWPRLLPEGTGRVNEEGVQFYNDLIDELLANDIVPFPTMYHWDMPQCLMELGGWGNPKIADWFGEFAALLAERFGDRVKYFATYNEPSIFMKGVIQGIYPPGLKTSPNFYMKAWHNMLRAHGAAVKALRAIPDVKIGITPTLSPFIPQSEADVEACRDQLFKVKRTVNGKAEDMTRTFICVSSMLLDPIIYGRYPQDGLELLGQYLPENWQDDMELISQSIDFIGINCYNGKPAIAQGEGVYRLPKPQGDTRTSPGWPVTPECLRWVTTFVAERYGKPLYVTENGTSCHDWVSLDGKVHDPNRIDFINRYLLELEKAIDAGVDIRGYIVWSLTDDFELHAGYTERYGLVHVDFATQKRTIKDSGWWYKQVIESDGAYIHSHEGAE